MAEEGETTTTGDLIAKLVSESRDYQDVRDDVPETDEDKDLDHILQEREYRRRDIKWRLTWRPYVVLFFVAVLAYQNWQVFHLLVFAVDKEIISELEIVLPAVIAGTLLETAVIVRVIVEFIFRDIKYETFRDKGK